MSDGLRIGLIGCGRLAEVGYLPAIERAAGVRLAAVADPEPSRRGQAQNGARAFSNATELLDDGGVDALVLATPADAHLGDATAAAAAGVPVLVEKPPAPDVAGAAALARLDPVPRIAFNRRFQAHCVGLRPAPPSKRRVDLELELRYRRRGWRPFVADDDALLDLGPHLVDLARWISGSEPSSVRAGELSRDRAEFELELQRGGARIRAASDRRHRERVRARDRDSGRIVAQWSSGGRASSLSRRLRGGEQFLVRSLTLQLEAYARAVGGSVEPLLATARDGVVAMAVVDAVRRSAVEQGRSVPVVVPQT